MAGKIHLSKRSKYRAVRTTVDGISFASKKEAVRYSELMLLLKAGHIKNLELQPRFEFVINGVHCGHYTADSRYFDMRLRCMVTEDVKSPASRTEAYQLRKRIVEALFGIVITEV